MIRFFIIFIICFFGLTARSAAVDDPDPSDFVRDVSARIQLLIAEDRRDELFEFVEGLLAREMIAKFVLGRHIKELSKSELSQFIKNYGKYIVRIYIDKLTNSNGITNVIAHEALSMNRYLVNTTATLNDSVFALDYVLIKDAGKFYLLDVIAEGIRLSYSVKEEVQRLVEQYGIKELQIKVANRAGIAE